MPTSGIKSLGWVYGEWYCDPRKRTCAQTMLKNEHRNLQAMSMVQSHGVCHGSSIGFLLARFHPLPFLG